MASNKPETRTVSCPTCGSAVAWTPAQRWRPFCCERCKLIDLGSWFDESNRIPDDTETPVIPDRNE